jgi:hypothetical protein
MRDPPLPDRRGWAGGAVTGTAAALDYNTLIMFSPRNSIRAFAGLAAALLLLSVAFAQTAKRPLNHRDYDGWHTIIGQRLSNDGKFLAYGVFPQEGDGEVIVRDLITGKDTHLPAGERPQPVPSATAEEGPPPEARVTTIAFSSDSKFVVFSTFPAKADTDKAKKEKKTADQLPKDGMVIVNLSSAQVTTVDRVRRFAMPEKAAGYLAYQREAVAEKPAAAPADSTGGDGDRQRGGRGGRAGGAAAGGAGARPQFGADLVLRALADGAERTFTDVAEFHFTEDGKQLIYAVAAHDTAKNGVFVAKPGTADAPTALLDGKGKYSKLTVDENQTELAFLSDRDDAASKQPKWKIYRWDRQANTAAELVSDQTPGLRSGMAISDHGNLSFSHDGSRLFFGVAQPAPPARDDAEAAADPTREKAVVDLWSYKDEYLQPVQKLRATRDRDRTFQAAYLIPEHKLVQLADDAMETVTASESPQWLMGSDDREYRKLQDYDEHYNDTYLVDAATGQRKLLVKRNHGNTSWSPSGRYLLNFDGKDWSSISVPDGKTVNLTASLGVKFFNEDTDTPGIPGAYGSAGWTKDGKSVLLYDRYDIWKISPDGAGAKNITAGYGRGHEVRLRYIRTEAEPRERWIDPARPLLLQGENLKTMDSGFFRGSIDGGEPTVLIMAAKSFSAPVKAKDADVYLLTEQTFDEFPDLMTTGGSFQELRKVSNANPQKARLLWGNAELVAFTTPMACRFRPRSTSRKTSMRRRSTP